MLNKQEELRLGALLDVARVDIENNVKDAREYKVEAILWLASKLQELNNELKRADKSR
jgi:hypothetical protein